MTTIKFTDEHLRTILTALEVYSRLRAGQIKIAMEEAFPEYWLTYIECDQIEKCVRSFLFPDPPQLKYDGHGGYYDQYGGEYDENGKRVGEPTWEDKAREKRSHLPNRSYYGVGSKEIGDGQIAWEILSTLRQYISLKNNDGYHGMGVNYQDPLKLSEVPLPEIEGFSAEKKFQIKGKAVVNKLRKMEETKDFTKFWEVVREYLSRNYPELKSYDQARVEPEGNHYVVLVKGARKN